MNNLQPFLRLLIGQWRGLGLGLVLGALCVLATVALLTLSGWLICAAAIAGWVSVHALAFNYFLPAAGIRFFALLRIGSRYGERVINHNATFAILRDLRTWCYQRLEPLAPLHFQRYRSGDLLQRLVSDIDDLNNVYLRILSPLVVSVLLLVALFFFLHWFFYSTTFIGCGTFLLILLLTMMLGGWLGRGLGGNIVEQMSSMRSHLITTLQSHYEIIVFGLSSQRERDFSALQARLQRLQRQFSSRQGLMNALMLLLFGVMLVAILYCGMYWVRRQQLHPAILGMVVLLLIAAYEVLAPLPVACQLLGKTLTAAARLNDIIESEPAVRFEYDQAVDSTGFDLSLQELCFHYPDNPRRVLNDINLTVSEGERIVITGSTGAGKSTLVFLLCRCWDPTSGCIMLGGVELGCYPEAGLRQRVAIAKQRTHIFNASVRRNLLISDPTITDETLWAVLDALQLGSVIQQTRDGLETEMGEFGQAFSGGQVKRLGIARVLLSTAKLLIFDEPAEGLDAVTFRRLWHSIQPWLVDRSVIVISHQHELFDDGCQYYRINDATLAPMV